MRYLVALLMLAGCDDAPRYQIAPGTTTAAIWRLDTKTGEIKYCFWSGSPLEPSSSIVCYPKRWDELSDAERRNKLLAAGFSEEEVNDALKIPPPHGFDVVPRK